MVEQQPYGRQQIHALSLQFVDALSAVGSIHQVFWTERPEAPMPFQLADDMQLSVNKIDINPVSGANRAEGAAVERLRNKMTYRNSLVSERHPTTRNQHGHRSEG